MPSLRRSVDRLPHGYRVSGAHAGPKIEKHLGLACKSCNGMHESQWQLPAHGYGDCTSYVAQAMQCLAIQPGNSKRRSELPSWQDTKTRISKMHACQCTQIGQHKSWSFITLFRFVCGVSEKALSSWKCATLTDSACGNGKSIDARPVQSAR